MLENDQIENKHDEFFHAYVLDNLVKALRQWRASFSLNDPCSPENIRNLYSQLSNKYYVQNIASSNLLVYKLSGFPNGSYGPDVACVLPNNTREDRALVINDHIVDSELNFKIREIGLCTQLPFKFEDPGLELNIWPGTHTEFVPATTGASLSLLVQDKLSCQVF